MRRRLVIAASPVERCGGIGPPETPSERVCGLGRDCADKTRSLQKL